MADVVDDLHKMAQNVPEPWDETLYRAIAEMKQMRAEAAHYLAMLADAENNAVSLHDENAELWEYVWAMEAFNIFDESGKPTSPEIIARLNHAQAMLKVRQVMKLGGQHE